jgi:hypothetical protein
VAEGRGIVLLLPQPPHAAALHVSVHERRRFVTDEDLALNAHAALARIPAASWGRCPCG